MKRAKTKAELEADNFKNTSHEKPLRGEPQLIIKEVQQGLTVEHEKTNYLACLKIANLASIGEDSWFFDESHFTKLGHKEIAKNLLPILEDMLNSE